MSRLELSAIQTKLKAAIQNHQMLVVKMKGDNQNAALKKGLSELQEEIKRLSEEQKKIVVRVRENLVKSSTQTQQPATPVVTLAPTITAIGQPRIVSFPTQGGATILPVGMVAVPIAHMQRPALGMTLHPASTGPMPQATSISLIPTGIISGGCNISLNPINSGATINLGNTVSGIILGNNSLISTTEANPPSNPSLGVVESNIHNSTSSIAGGPGGVAAVVSAACIPSSNTALTSLTSMANLILSNSISNGQSSAESSNLILTNSSSSNCTVSVPSTSAIIPVNPAPPVNSMTVNSTGSGIVISQFPQQPLVQPQLLQKQQQQILQMIQQQQQQQPQQRLPSHTAIKVPQYTASVIRPASGSTLVQFCNIAPAPTTVTTASSVRVVPTSAPQSLPARPAVSKEALIPKEQQTMPKPDVVKPHPQQQQPPPPPQQTKQPLKQVQRQEPQQVLPPVNGTAVKTITVEEQEKLSYMKALDLYTIEALKEVMRRRSERKRRTTANPNYSFGFDFSRRDRNGSNSPKKPRTRGKVSAVPGRGNDWSDQSSGHQQSRASSKSNRSNDNHDDYCAACGKGGQLLMCGTCRLVYHLDCLNPPLTEAPSYAWSCPKCLVSGKGCAHLNSEALAKVHSYMAKKSAKEEEHKRLQRKNKEINMEKNLLDSRSKELDKEMKEQIDLQSKLSAEEKKVKEELSTLSDFVRAMRDSKTGNHVPGSKASST